MPTRVGTNNNVLPSESVYSNTKANYTKSVLLNTILCSLCCAAFVRRRQRVWQLISVSRLISDSEKSNFHHPKSTFYAVRSSKYLKKSKSGLERIFSFFSALGDFDFHSNTVYRLIIENIQSIFAGKKKTFVTQWRYYDNVQHII